jgi:hypothetical protein
LFRIHFDVTPEPSSYDTQLPARKVATLRERNPIPGASVTIRTVAWGRFLSFPAFWPNSLHRTILCSAIDRNRPTPVGRPIHNGLCLTRVSSRSPGSGEGPNLPQNGHQHSIAKAESFALLVV